MSSRHTEKSLPLNQNHRKQSVSGEAWSLILVSYTDAVSCSPSALANCATLTCLQGEDCVDKTDGYYWLFFFYSSISADSSILKHPVYTGIRQPFFKISFCIVRWCRELPLVLPGRDLSVPACTQCLRASSDPFVKISSKTSHLQVLFLGFKSTYLFLELAW